LWLRWAKTQDGLYDKGAGAESLILSPGQEFGLKLARPIALC
jgi:hypothetical protein